MMYWDWETFGVAMSATVVFMIAVSIVASSIAKAVKSVRRQPRYTANLEICRPSGEKGRITATLSSDGALTAFVSDWRQEPARGGKR